MERMTSDQLLLIVVSLVSSTVTAVVGIGGGLMLVALMPSFLPAQAVIPVHGAVQLASNLSRALFAWRQVLRRILAAFVAGAVVGGLAGWPLVGALPLEAVPLILGAAVLLLVWIPRSWLPGSLPGGYFAAGAVQTFVSLFIGATGPLNAALLAREELPRDQTVVTHGAMMTLVHLAKCIVFAAAGFAFADYLWLLLGMLAATTLGSYLGTRLRPLVSERNFKPLFKGLLTLLALRLLWKALV
jgi:uncharacterized protein